MASRGRAGVYGWVVGDYKFYIFSLGVVSTVTFVVVHANGYTNHGDVSIVRSVTNPGNASTDIGVHPNVVSAEYFARMNKSGFTTSDAVYSTHGVRLNVVSTYHFAQLEASGAMTYATATGVWGVRLYVVSGNHTTFVGTDGNTYASRADAVFGVREHQRH